MKHRVSFQKIAPLMSLCAVLGISGIVSVSRAQTAPASSAASRAIQVPLEFSGGYETDRRDGGRPVVLIAGALGVPDGLFREAFRKVRPARAGSRPEPEQVRQNKVVLLRALGKYGITNERLDTVSNYYRYVPGRAMWPTQAASGYAVVENGVVTKYVVTDGGSGYSSLPVVRVPGYPGASAKVQLVYGPCFDRNGSVSAITVAPADSSR